MKKILTREILMCITAIFILSSLGLSVVASAYTSSPGGNAGFLTAIDAPIENSIPISTREQLQNMKKNGNYHLTKDIDLSGEDWEPITSRPNIFDGQGFVIHNLTITGNYQYAGLFAEIKGTIVKNLGLENTNINVKLTQTGYAGAISAYGGVIVNCYNNGTVSTSSSDINCTGGISGYGEVISYCYNKGVVSASSSKTIRVGGISGSNGDITLCYNTAEVTASMHYPSSSSDAIAGGICGINGAISMSFNGGNISAYSESNSKNSKACVGGIVGECNSKINNCYNTGDISAYAVYKAYAGGISGNRGSIANCYNTGKLSASTSYEDSTLTGGVCANVCTASYSYWNADSQQTANDITSQKGIGGEKNDNGSIQLTTSQMRRQESFEGFDFNSVWEFRNNMNNGFPVLINIPHSYETSPDEPVTNPSEDSSDALSWGDGGGYWDTGDYWDADDETDGLWYDANWFDKQQEDLTEPATTSNIKRYVVLALDMSATMRGRPLEALKESATILCRNIASDESYVAIVAYSTKARIVQGFTGDYQSLADAINSLKVGGSSNMYDALLCAEKLCDSVSIHNPDADKTIILLSDGLPNGDVTSTTGPYTAGDYSGYRDANAVFNKANELKRKGYCILTIGFFHAMTKSEFTSLQNLKFAINFMMDLQGCGYVEVKSPDGLTAGFSDAETKLNTKFLGKDTTPSGWASDTVTAAAKKNLVPLSLQSKYSQPITRAEFCALAVKLYETLTGDKIAGRKSFEDTDDINVEKAAAIGVVSGIGNNKFDPNANLTREQAAVMLASLSQALGNPLAKNEPAFDDRLNISTWAYEPVGQIQAAGIMSGIGNNTFAPKNLYTREQSITTILSLYDMVT